MVGSPRIGVVIVTFRSAPWIERCLDTVLRDPHCAYCIVVDNDGSGAASKSHCSVTYIRTSHNLGFGRACNVGFKILQDSDAEVDIFATINPDTWMETDWGCRMLDAFDNNPEYAIMAPLQLTYASPGHLAPWTIAVVGDRVEQFDAITPVEWVEGSALFARRDLINSVGGFDPIYDMYYEEVDMCRRTTHMGHRIGVVTAARYHHATGGSFATPEAPARLIKKDIGQILYIMTDPAESAWAAALHVARLVARRTWSWARGRYPPLPSLVAGLLRQMWSNRRAIIDKRIRDGQLKANP